MDSTSEEMPVLIVHGTRDRVIPFSEAEALSAAAPRAELLPVQGADHNDFWSIAGRPYVDLLTSRVREWTAE